MDTYTALRQKLRQQRSQLSELVREQAAQQLTALLVEIEIFKKSRHIAGYIAQEGEIDPKFVMEQIWFLGKVFYLPVMRPDDSGRLWFVRYDSGDSLVVNHYGIYEPPITTHKLCPAWALDLALVPIVAFNRQGHRLGRGKGYYDKTFAFMADKKISKPYLVGLAYEFQKAVFKAKPWDISLGGIVTEQRSYWPH